MVHDGLVQRGGAEKLLISLATIFPETVVFSPLASKYWFNHYRGLKIPLKLSILQNLPLKSFFEKLIFFIYPLIFAKYDFSGFDVVISSSARFAHFINVPKGAIHFCYCNSPGRMFWQPFDYFYKTPILCFLTLPFLHIIRLFDWLYAQKVDYFFANSSWPKKRISSFYQRDSVVVYPGVEIKTEIPKKDQLCKKEGPFLVVSRLVSWKKIDLAIKACQQLDLPLIIVGGGPDEGRLKKMLSAKVFLAGRLTEEQLSSYYESCRAVIITQEEDFGLVAIEAQSYGKPVIAYAKGGALETIVSGKTGVFFKYQSVASLVEALLAFEKMDFFSIDCFQQASKFNQGKFVSSIRNFINEKWKIKQQGLTN